MQILSLQPTQSNIYFVCRKHYTLDNNKMQCHNDVEEHKKKVIKQLLHLIIYNNITRKQEIRLINNY